MYRDHLYGRLLGVSDVRMRTATCLYTETENGDFLIDWHPDIPDVLAVSACSGHGFKHSAAIGEAVAESIIAGKLNSRIGHFALKC